MGAITPLLLSQGGIAPPPPLTFIQYDLYTILKFMSGPQPIDMHIYLYPPPLNTLLHT